MIFLPLFLFLDGGKNLVVEPFDGHVFVEHGRPLAELGATGFTP